MGFMAGPGMRVKNVGSNRNIQTELGTPYIDVAWGRFENGQYHVKADLKFTGLKGLAVYTWGQNFQSEAEAEEKYRKLLEGNVRAVPNEDGLLDLITD